MPGIPKSMRPATWRIRSRAWTRHIIAGLVPNWQESNSLVSKLNSELVSKAKAKAPTLKAALKPETFTNLMNKIEPDGAFLIGNSRWSEWWVGKSQPTAETVKIVGKILDRSELWFGDTIADWGKDDDPLLTLLYCLDLFSANGKVSVRANSCLANIIEIWEPKNITEGLRGRVRLGWYLSPLSVKLRLPANVAIEHYSILEPGRIVESMLWSGFQMRVDKTNFFKHWTLHLVSASLAIYSILFELGGTKSAISLSGNIGRVAAVIVSIFIKHIDLCSSENDPIKSRRAISAIVSSADTVLPATDEFIEFLMEAVNCFEMEFAKLDFDPRNLNKLSLDAKFVEIVRR